MPDPAEARSLPDQEVRDVPVWTIRPGTMARGWAARIEGPVSALDLEVVPAIDLWDAYRATCDGIPLPFGAWMTQDGPTQTIADVRELREAYDTTGEQLTAAEAERDRLRAENKTLTERYAAVRRAYGIEAQERGRLETENVVLLNERNRLHELLDDFDRYAGVPGDTEYNGSPFQAQVRAGLAGESPLPADEGEASGA
jgi:hypothetical protein